MFFPGISPGSSARGGGCVDDDAVAPTGTVVPNGQPGNSPAGIWCNGWCNGAPAVRPSCSARLSPGSGAGEQRRQTAGVVKQDIGDGERRSFAFPKTGRHEHEVEQRPFGDAEPICLTPAVELFAVPGVEGDASIGVGEGPPDTRGSKAIPPADAGGRGRSRAVRHRVRRWAVRRRTLEVTTRGGRGSWGCPITIFYATIRSAVTHRLKTDRPESIESRGGWCRSDGDSDRHGDDR